MQVRENLNEERKLAEEREGKRVRERTGEEKKEN